MGGIPLGGGWRTENREHKGTCAFAEVLKDSLGHGSQVLLLWADRGGQDGPLQDPGLDFLRIRGQFEGTNPIEMMIVIMIVLVVDVLIVFSRLAMVLADAMRTVGSRFHSGSHEYRNNVA